MSTRTASFGPGTTLYGTCLISCATSEYLRPMKRLIEKTVCSGFSAACRLATCPTSLSPVLVNATTDGVMRPPSLLTITVGLSPSIVATAELVVPRSIPIAFSMTHTPLVDVIEGIGSIGLIGPILFSWIATRLLLRAFACHHQFVLHV